MIIFYNKLTGEIYGSIEGRVHDENTLNKALIKPSNVDAADVGKYVVSYKLKTKKIKRDVTKNVVNPKTLEIKAIKVGEEDAVVGAGLEMNDPLKDVLSGVETKRLNISSKRFVVNEGKVVGIEDKPVVAKVKPVKSSPDQELNKIQKLEKQVGDLQLRVRMIEAKLDANN